MGRKAKFSFELKMDIVLRCLSNMESYNAILIQQGKSQAERMQLLHELAVQQMRTLEMLNVANLPETGINDKG